MSKVVRKSIVPKLRFPEYENSEEWFNKPMGDLFDFLSTNTLSRDKLNYQSGKVKNIHYGDIHTKFKTLFRIENELVPYINESESLEKIKPECYCSEGDVVFADASEDLEDIGKSIELVSLKNEKLLSGTHTILARPKDNNFTIGFNGYLFKSTFIRNQIKNESQGAKVLGISAKKLAKINLLFPKTKTEQKKVADCLSSLDDLITAQGEKIDALKNYKKGLLQYLFPQDGETVPRLRFPEFKESSSWINTSLGEVATITSGGTPSRSKKEYWNGTIPWVTTTLIDFNTIDAANEYITAIGLKESSAKLFPKNTILIAMYGQGITRGKVAILGIEAATNQACAAILLKKELSTNFLFQNLAGRYEEMRNMSNSGGQENLSGELIKGIKFSYPESKLEQQKISELLFSIDSQILSESAKTEALKNHKKGLLQHLFPEIESNEKGVS